MLAARFALSWMTVLPVGPGRGPTPREAARALTCLPLVGLVVGLVGAAVVAGARAAGADPLLAAALAVTAGAVLTRGMHLDALADTADALGSYAPPARALEIMRSGPVGPMGVAAIALALLVEVAAVAQLVDAGRWAAVVAAAVVARVVPVLSCSRGTRSATDSGFGAVVAGSQGPGALCCAAGAGVLAAGGAALSWAPDHRWAAALGGVAGAVVLAALLTTLVVAAGRHAARRVGGLTGDVLGAAVQLAGVGAAVLFALLP